MTPGIRSLVVEEIFQLISGGCVEPYSGYTRPLTRSIHFKVSYMESSILVSEATFGNDK